MNPNSNGWYVAITDGRARGPFERAELLRLRSAGEISDDSLVWTLDLAEWVPLRRALPAGTAATVLPPAIRPPPHVPVQRTPHPSPATGKPPTRRAQSHEPRPADKLGKAFEALRSPGLTAAAGKDAQADALLLGQRSLLGLRRLLARWLDTALLGGLLWALLIVLLLKLPDPLREFTILFYRYPLLALLLMGLLLIPLEALLLALGGYTPGKAIFGLKVVSREGGRIPLDRAFRRAKRVHLLGNGLLIPPFSLLAAGVAVRRLQTRGMTQWDEELSTDVRAAPLTPNRWWGGLAALAIAAALLFENAFTRLGFALAMALR